MPNLLPYYNISTTFEMPHEFLKNQNDLRFLQKVHMLSLNLLQKFHLKILIFESQLEMSKIA
jgi:hypothetical protein